MTDLDGATSAGVGSGYPADPGEYAARWNSWPAERRADHLRLIIENAEIATRCFVSAHEGHIEDLERERATAKASGWDEALNAIAWCVENGSPNYSDAIEYVAKNNPHRSTSSNTRQEPTDG